MAVDRFSWLYLYGSVFWIQSANKFTDPSIGITVPQIEYKLALKGHGGKPIQDFIDTINEVRLLPGIVDRYGLMPELTEEILEPILKEYDLSVDANGILSYMDLEDPNSPNSRTPHGSPGALQGQSGSGDCGCGKTTQAKPGTSNSGTSKTDIAIGENIDCYSKRATDDKDEKDGYTAQPINKILNNSFSASATLTVDETFQLSNGPRSATTWSMTPTVPGLTATTTSMNQTVGSTTTAKNVLRVTGTVDTSVESQTFRIKIRASDGSGTIDEREYTFCPLRPAANDKLVLVKPYKPYKDNLTAKINSGFGMRYHPIHKTNKLHSGQDWVTEQQVGKGQGSIIAAADGEVIFAGTNGGYGQCVKINHKSQNGKLLGMTLYGHCSRLLVSVGQKVAAGQVIAMEGSTGASTGPHLHFELRLGGTTPVDPSPYFGSDVDAAPYPPTSEGGTISTTLPLSNTRTPLTSKLVEARIADCPKVVNNDTGTAGADTYIQQANRASCTPASTASNYQNQTKTLEAIDAALAESDLSDEDKRVIKFIARIESGNDPYAKNPASSATGLYQMLDRTAEKYYAKALGLRADQVTCEVRTDAAKATKAMIEFYKTELLPYWQEYQNNGTLAGKQIKNTSHAARYENLSKPEFIYGLLHHDGVGNAANGIDKGGVAYFKKRAVELGFA